MRVAILGAGAIGAYVGACLARGGVDVTVIARGAHLEAMREHGVRVLSPRGDFSAHPRATDRIEAVSEAEVVFVALKAYSVPALAEAIGDALDPGAAAIWAQNGLPWWYFTGDPGPFEGTVLQSVDPGGVIAASIRPGQSVGCVVYVATDLVEPGVVRHTEGTRFAIGEPDRTLSDRCRAISEVFAAGGLKAPPDAELREQIWLKLLGNVAFNPASALTGATLGELGTTLEMRAMLSEVLGECAAVAERLGVRIRVPLERRLEAGIAVGDHKTSMLQDLEAGKPLELDCLTGALIELAGLLDLDVPHVRTLHACTKLLEAQRMATRAGQKTSGG